MFNPNFGYGYAAALAWVYFFIIALMLLVTTRLVSPKEASYRVVKELEKFKR
jgi:ABC-type sugar transport system permease subunit